MKLKIILAILIIFLIGSTATFAAQDQAIEKIIKQNPLVAQYVQVLNDTIKSLTNKIAILEQTVKLQEATIGELQSTTSVGNGTLNRFTNLTGKTRSEINAMVSTLGSDFSVINSQPQGTIYNLDMGTSRAHIWTYYEDSKSFNDNDLCTAADIEIRRK